MRKGDLVQLTRRWDPGRKTPRYGVILEVRQAGPVDPREDGVVAVVLWNDGETTIAWNHEIIVIKDAE